MAASATLLSDAALASFAAALYAYTGRLVARRPVENLDSRTAQQAFVCWWYGLGVVTALGAVGSLLGALGHVDLDTHVALRVLTIPFLAVLLWGLVYYLTFIHTGKKRLIVPITVFHLLLLAGYTYLVVWLHPTGVSVEAWDVELVDERDIAGPLAVAVYGALVGPVLFAAFGYLSLFFRTRDPHQRYRIALVSGSFIAWFGAVLLAAILDLEARIAWWPLASRLIALGATALVLLAFRPPRWVRRRLGLPGAYA